MMLILEMNYYIHLTNEGNENCIGQRGQGENVMQTVGQNSARDKSGAN